MAEVAYLLGAGASAECLPVVADMKREIGELLSFIKPINKAIKQGLDKIDREKFTAESSRCFEALQKLQRNCERHYSIDTYAKKLFLTNPDEFFEFKIELSLYFTLGQIWKSDKRYDNFFASIMHQNCKLPPRVKVFSWNYDAQLELSYSNFSDNPSLSSSRLALSTTTPNDYDPKKDYQDFFLTVKLNGTASFRNNEEYQYLINDNEKEQGTDFVTLYATYYKLFDKKNTRPIPDLKFAWENEHYNKMFEILAPAMSKIQVLVVIGYSFPFFNRDVDLALLQNLTKLRKIYIQDKFPASIKETMEEFYNFKKRNIEVILKENLNQFVFPKELDITLGPPSKFSYIPDRPKLTF